MPPPRWLRIVPPVLALLYPAIIWAGPAISPALLVVSLVVPLAGLIAVRHTPPLYPRSRAVSLLVVAAPPLYSWLGGLLDFQRALPINSLGAWDGLWAALTVVTATERARSSMPLPERPSRLAFAHGCSAAIISLFAVAHLVNHLAGWWGGGPLHVTAMSSLRTIYRARAAETVLLGAIAFQGLSGLALLRWHRERSDSWWTTAQTASGVYMGVFFLSHLTAALRARWLRGVDTDWHWLTADSMLTDWWSARLAPYYFLAVIAFGVHAGLGLRYVLRAQGWSEASADVAGCLPPAAAAIASALIMSALLSA